MVVMVVMAAEMKLTMTVTMVTVERTLTMIRMVM